MWLYNPYLLRVAKLGRNQCDDKPNALTFPNVLSNIPWLHHLCVHGVPEMGSNQCGYTTLVLLGFPKCVVIECG